MGGMIAFPPMNNTNIVISSYGNAIAVGIEGSAEQIEMQFNRFFNHGAAGAFCTEEFSSKDGSTGESYLHFTCDNFAYFLSSEENMIKALLNEMLMQCNMEGANNSMFIGKKGGAMNTLLQNAIESYKNIKRENFMGYKPTENNVYQQLDGGAPSWDASSVSLAESVLI